MDADLARPGRPATPLAGPLVILWATVLVSDGSSPAPVVPLFLLGTAATLYVGWRLRRMCRAGSIRGDRRYDRVIRPTLGPDYAASESATRARRRRRHQPSRSRGGR